MRALGGFCSAISKKLSSPWLRLKNVFWNRPTGWAHFKTALLVFDSGIDGMENCIIAGVKENGLKSHWKEEVVDKRVEQWQESRAKGQEQVTGCLSEAQPKSQENPAGKVTVMDHPMNPQGVPEGVYSHQHGAGGV